MLTPQELEARLAEAAGRHDIPGAVLAVRRGTRVVEAASGVLDVETGYPATTDSVFQTGSITKVWTATLIMQLADEGLVDLDAPVARYLPGFRVADEAASAAVTVRQLLCHTGGFEGDIFDDHGPGDDAVEQFVAHLGERARQLFPPGERWSYCNSGYVVLGRIVEVLTGQTWEAALRERIAVPLGMTHVATSPAEAIRHRVSMGHVPGPDGTLVKAPVWAMPRSNAPAGSTLTLSVRDQLRFAAMHLSGGLAPDGTRVLSEESAHAMREPQATLPLIPPLGRQWGLGWELFDYEGGLVIGHDGGTLGQVSLLRLVPGADVAVALLTGGGEFYGLYPLIAELLDELAGVKVPPLPVPPAVPPTVDPRYFTGRYESGTLRADVAEVEGGLSVSVRPLGALAELSGEAMGSADAMVPLDARTLIAREPKEGRHAVHVFLGDGPRADFLHLGRAIPRA
ncbi:serine hydrolase domain-containing protein [Spirillospora sp. NPDC049652]